MENNPLTSQEVLQSAALKIAALVAQVVNETARGRRHQLGAYQETDSLIVKPGAPKNVKLVGVLLPIDEALKLVDPAGEILKTKEEKNGKD